MTRSVAKPSHRQRSSQDPPPRSRNSENHDPVGAPKVTLDNLTLSRKEGFQAKAEAPKREQPELLTTRQLAALSTDARREYNEQRNLWHANLPTISTSQLLELREDLTDIVASNQHDGDKAKGAIAIEGSAGIGKTFATLDFAYGYHNDQIAQHGRLTRDGNDDGRSAASVCRATPASRTSTELLGFYNHAGIKRGTAVDFANRALDCVLSCETKLLIVDELHFLKQRTTSVEISNQFKYISNEFPVTIIFIGIGLRQRGLYSDGTYADGILGQSGRTHRTPCRLREFTIDTPERRSGSGADWCWPSRSDVVLARKAPGHARRWLSYYLFERSSGRIGPLTTLINRGLPPRDPHRRLNVSTRNCSTGCRTDAASEQQRPGDAGQDPHMLSGETN